MSGSSDKVQHGAHGGWGSLPYLGMNVKRYCARTLHNGSIDVLFEHYLSTILKPSLYELRSLEVWP